MKRDILKHVPQLTRPFSWSHGVGLRRPMMPRPLGSNSPSCPMALCVSVCVLSSRFYLFILEREEGRETERERNISVSLPLVCLLLGTWPTTQACALTGNRTGDPSVHELTLNPLSHTS